MMFKNSFYVLGVASVLCCATAVQAKDVRPAAVTFQSAANASLNTPAPAVRRVAKRNKLLGLGVGASALAVGGAVATVALVAVAASSSSSPN